MSWLDEIIYEDALDLSEDASSDAVEKVQKFIGEFTPNDITDAIESFTCFSHEEMEFFKSELVITAYKSKREEIIKAVENAFNISEADGRYFLIPYNERRQFRNHREAIEVWVEKGGFDND